MRPRIAHWRGWMTDADFRRWYERNALRSEVTAQEFARILDRYVRLNQTTPKELAQLARKRRKVAEDQIDDFIVRLHKEGKSGGYIANYVKAVKSWLDQNDVQLHRRFRIPNRDTRSTLLEEVVPSREGLRATLNAATPRGRVVIAFVALSGLRPGALGTYHGTDGLKVRDLPEMRIRGGKVSFTALPALVAVRPQLSKGGHSYPTFLPEEGANYLSHYLEQRLSGGERLGEDSAIVTVSPRALQNQLREGQRGGHISTKNVTDDIRDAMRAAGVVGRPYVWRSYFDTNLLIAESAGKMPSHFRIAWMGHKKGLGMEGPYTTQRHRLPASFVKEMRERFRDASAFLVTSGPPGAAALAGRTAEIERLLEAQKASESVIEDVVRGLNKDGDDALLRVFMDPEKAPNLKARFFTELLRKMPLKPLLDEMIDTAVDRRLAELEAASKNG